MIVEEDFEGFKPELFVSKCPIMCFGCYLQFQKLHSCDLGENIMQRFALDYLSIVWM